MNQLRRSQLLLIADETDEAAHAFRDKARHGEIVLTTPRDLSREGWLFRPEEPEATLLVAGGAPVAAADIGCVLTRLAAVTEADLPHIVPDDRTYVAAEMTAFLLAFLSALDRPVVNRPTPQCLCGPQGTDAAWRRTARTLGLAAAPLRLRTVPGGDEMADASGALVAVVGGRAFGAVDRRQGEAAVALARGVAADLLSVAFDRDAPLAVLHAYPGVDLDDMVIAEAVAHLCAAKTAA